MRVSILVVSGLLLAGMLCAGIVAEEGKDEGWVSLFNGKNLDGWKAMGNAAWSVEDKCLVGRQGPEGAAGDLLTEAEYANFELKVTYKVQWPANTGVWFRYQSASQAYQADILEYKNPVCWSGSLYCPGKVFIALNEDPSIVKREGWNTMYVRAEGDRLIVKLNGTQVADVKDDSSAKGRIGFQVHAGEPFADMRITVREAKVRPLESAK